MDTIQTRSPFVADDMPKPWTVFHHARCWDGYGAAWAAWRALGSSANYVTCSYGEEIPAVKGGSVFVLDFSFSYPQMLELADRVEKVVVCDHHVSAYEALKQSSAKRIADVSFDLNFSGATLAWKYFHGEAEIPQILRYIEDRDLWRFALMKSRELNAFIRSFPYDIQSVQKLNLAFSGSYGSWQQLVSRGAAILDREQQIINEQLVNTIELNIGGVRVQACNATTLFSEVAGKLAEEDEFGAAFIFCGKDKVAFSLRSRKSGADVSEIAKRYGGGGHVNAAGFQVSMREFMHMLA